MDAEEAPKRALLEFEDVGGIVPDEEAEEANDDRAQGLACPRITDGAALLRLLARRDEVQELKQPGRYTDAHKAMAEAASFFASDLDSFQSARDRSRAARVFDGESLGVCLLESLEHQKQRAQRLRDVQNLGAAEHEDVATDVSATLSEHSVPFSQRVEVPEHAFSQGQVLVAHALARQATLNTDQLGLVALLAQSMQQDWLHHRDVVSPGASEHRWLPAPRKIMRLLIVGGGGCGKTRVINHVLVPLLRAYYGPQGCV